MCTLRMNYLTPPTTQVYGMLSIFAAIFAACGNTLVLIVLWMPNQRIKSNKILTSLAISDSLVGYVLLPIFSWQLLNTEQLQSCSVDYTREYLTTVFIGSSLFTLGVVSYDRYILLTKLTNYNRYMTNRKIIILLTVAWVFPIVSPALRFLGKGPFLYCVILITSGPLVVLTFTYILIAKAIRENDKKLKLKRKNTAEYPESSLSVDEMRSSESETQSSTMNNNNSSFRKSVSTRRIKSKHIKLAKTVAVLIVCYAICLLPSSVWSICDLINESHHYAATLTIQNMYILACFAAGINSCINPVIYIFKQPGFKKSLRKLFKKLKFW